MAWTMRVPPALDSRLLEIASSRGMTRQDLVLNVLKDWVKSYEGGIDGSILGSANRALPGVNDDAKLVSGSLPRTEDGE